MKGQCCDKRQITDNEGDSAFCESCQTWLTWCPKCQDWATFNDRSGPGFAGGLIIHVEYNCCGFIEHDEEGDRRAAI